MRVHVCVYLAGWVYVWVAGCEAGWMCDCMCACVYWPLKAGGFLCEVIAITGLTVFKKMGESIFSYFYKCSKPVKS